MNVRAFSALALSLGLMASPAQALNLDVDIGADNKYISEGRDNLEEGGIAWAGAALGITDNLGVALAYGEATDSNVDYNEFNAAIEYGLALGDFDLGASYTRLEFMDDDESDNELGFGVAYAGLEYLTPYADYVYSTEANGSFVELGVESEWAFNHKLTLAPYATMGIDYGYATAEYDGISHYSLGAVLSYAFADNLSLDTTVEHDIAGEDVKRDTGSDDGETWVGVHLAMSF